MTKFPPYTLFEEMSKCHKTGNHRTAIIVFDQSNFTQPYSEESRSYASYSDQWGWNPRAMGRCKLGSCLDGTDPDVRLDWYEWTVEFWYWKD